MCDGRTADLGDGAATYRVGPVACVARSSIHRWLKAFQKGKPGGRHQAAAPVDETPREIADLIRDIFARTPMWGRDRIAMTLWALRVFISATTVRDILLRPRPQASTPAPAEAEESVRPRKVIARYPNHVWSVDRTRVMRWGIRPTWVLVAIDHLSRAVMTVAPVEGPDAGWVVDVLEGAFLCHGPPKHLISDQEGVCMSEVYHNQCRSHRRLHGATPSMIHELLWEGSRLIGP